MHTSYDYHRLYSFLDFKRFNKKDLELILVYKSEVQKGKLDLTQLSFLYFVLSNLQLKSNFFHVRQFWLYRKIKKEINEIIRNVKVDSQEIMIQLMDTVKKDKKTPLEITTIVRKYLENFGFFTFFHSLSYGHNQFDNCKVLINDNSFKALPSQSRIQILIYHFLYSLDAFDQVVALNNDDFDSFFIEFYKRQHSVSEDPIATLVCKLFKKNEFRRINHFIHKCFKKIVVHYIPIYKLWE